MTQPPQQPPQPPDQPPQQPPQEGAPGAQWPPPQGPPVAGPPPPGAQPYGPPHAGPYGAPGYGQGYGGAPGSPPLPGAGKRFLARLIDYLIVGVVGGVASLPVFLAYLGAQRQALEAAMAGGVAPEPFLGLGYLFGLTIIPALVWFCYDWLLHGFASGQTIGKKVLKTRVVGLDGTPLSAGKAAARSAVFALPPIVWCIGTLFWLLNALSLLWDRPYQQCWHDKAAGTVVVEAT